MSKSLGVPTPLLPGVSSGTPQVGLDGNRDGWSKEVYTLTSPRGEPWPYSHRWRGRLIRLEARGRLSTSGLKTY